MIQIGQSQRLSEQIQLRRRQSQAAFEAAGGDVIEAVSIFREVREYWENATPETLFDGDRSMDEQTEEICRRGAKWERVIAARGKRYVTCEFGNFEITTEPQKTAVDQLRKFAEKLPCDRGLALFGPVGTGKDHLLISLCRIAIMQHGLSLIWTTGPAICAAFREPMRYDDVTEDSVLRRFASPAVLAISDPVITGGALSKFETDKLYEVIDRRYSDRQPTWFTINVANRDEMIASLGAAIVDRLIDGAVTIRCDWPSHRKPSPLEAPQ